MPEIFLSYSREDAEVADWVEQTLVAAGYEVFRDVSSMGVGVHFPTELDAAVRRADKVIGLWSAGALQREWVVKECTVALRQGKLIPVALSGLDDNDVPLVFDGVNRFTLPPPPYDRLAEQNLLAAVQGKARAAASPKQADRGPAKARQGPARRWLFPGLGMAVLSAAILAAALYLFGPETRAATGADLLRTGQIEAAAMSLLEECEAGNAESCGSLGYLHLSEALAASDLREARHRLEMGCVGQSAAACGNLGIVYAEGLGVEFDPGRARRYWGQACDLGSALGCGGLGWAKYLGWGGPVEADAGLALLRESCHSQNELWSCSRLNEVE